MPEMDAINLQTGKSLSYVRVVNPSPSFDAIEGDCMLQWHKLINPSRPSRFHSSIIILTLSGGYESSPSIQTTQDAKTLQVLAVSLH
ncbi:hypothetical protein CEXT_700011 [Caerostris extrusa]|uniref:Uncharacterized protein n=1 Tax=Caerostris extrusa TaxID=172846 RepID=A0AAV4TPY7_CAEEX|nr:hypothetical protein CEXT_700011 [Caerostris extrusa]